MALTHCPDCGAQVSESAVVCPQCGFPMRRDALATAAGRGGGGRSGSATNTAGMVIGGIVVAGIVGVVVIGILAAIAIPRFMREADRREDAEGESLLGRLYHAEHQHYAENGRYTADLGELAAGWQPDRAWFYDLEVRLGDTPQTLVCLEARPKPGIDARPMSMDSTGESYRDAGCTGETMTEFRSRDDVMVNQDVIPGEGGDAGARTLLREVYPGLVKYRAEHGRDPVALGMVLGYVHDSPASAQYRLSLNRRGGRMCISAVPRSTRGGDDLHAFSLDGDGRMYAGRLCSGTPLEQIETALPDSAVTGG